jgi:hypothetical protein
MKITLGFGIAMAAGVFCMKKHQRWTLASECRMGGWEGG